MHKSSKPREKQEADFDRSALSDPVKLGGMSDSSGHTLITACIGKDLRYRSISPFIEKYNGRSCQEFIGKEINEVPLLGFRAESLEKAITSALAEKEERELRLPALQSGMVYSAWVEPQISQNGEVEFVVLTVKVSSDQTFAACSTDTKSPTFEVENFCDLFSHIPYGIAFTTIDGKFISINPALEKILGYSQEEIVNKTLRDVVCAEDIEKSQCFVNQAINHEIEFFSLEKCYVCKDGHSVWARVTSRPIRDKNGTPLYFFAIIENITQNKRTEQELERERLFMKYMMDSTVDSIYFKDLENRFVRVNQATLKKFGLAEQDEILGKTDFDFFPPEIAQIDFDEEKRILETGEAMLDSEGLEVWPDRPDTWVSSSKVAVREVNGKLVGTFGISRDITDRKQKEEEIRQLNLTLEKKVTERTKELLLKNKELEEFTYTVSHDLKAPLRGISGYSSLLLQEHADQLDEEGKNFLGKLIHSAELLSDLIDDLLTYSRLERREITYTTLAMDEIVNILLDQFREEIDKKNVTLHLNLEHFLISSSHDLLIQIIQHFLENALKFTSQRRAPEIWIEYKNQGTTSLLSVRDNGIGFDNAYAEKIFEIFQRLNRADNYPGTGIGLALTKKAAQMLGYRVWAEGTIDQGATFYLEINNNSPL